MASDCGYNTVVFRICQEVKEGKALRGVKFLTTGLVRGSNGLGTWQQRGCLFVGYGCVCRCKVGGHRSMAMCGTCDILPSRCTCYFHPAGSGSEGDRTVGPSQGCRGPSTGGDPPHTETNTHTGHTHTLPKGLVLIPWCGMVRGTGGTGGRKRERVCT